MAKENGQKDNEAKTVKLKPEDYKIMVDWLEAGGKDMLLGGGKTKVGEQNRTKRGGFLALAEFVNKNQKKSSNLVKVDANSMKNRWNFFFKKYRKVKETSMTTGFGVTEEDVRKGITTVGQKLEKLCPQFVRMDLMFGDQANVDPSGFEETINVEDTHIIISPGTHLAQILAAPDDEPNIVEDDDLNLMDSPEENTPMTPTVDAHLDSGRPAKQQKRAGLESADGFVVPTKKVDKDHRHLLNQTFIDCSREKVRIAEEKLKWQMQCHEEKQELERDRLVQEKFLEERRWEKEENRWEKQTILETMKMQSHEGLEKEKMIIDRERLQQADRATRATVVKDALKQGKTMEEIKDLLSLIF